MANETAVVKKSPVIETLTSAKQNLIARLPKGMERDKFFLGIMTAIQKNKALAECDPKSVLLAAYDAAEVGCNLSPAMQLGWLIPYGKECNFQPSYRFFIQKAFETKEVKAFFAEVVYACDKFERQFAPKRNLFHAPGNPDERKRENAIGAYALVEFVEGTVEFEYMTAEQIDRHRKKSKQQNSMKWLDFWEEGWRITPIRVLAKRLPLKNRDFEKLIELVNADAADDIVIPAEVEPSMPREVAHVQEQPKQTAAAEEPEKAKEQSTEKPAETTQTNTTQANTMFADNDPDPFLTPAEMQTFWDKALGSGWKKTEVVAYLTKEFKVTALKDMRRSQAQTALESIAAARK